MRFLLAVLVCLCISAPLAAQRVTLVGTPGDSTAIKVRSILERGSYRLINRDTVLPADFTTTGDLVIVDARVALEGSVAGSVVVVRGNFFTRPRSSVAGPILVLGGSAFPSGLGENGPVEELDRRITVTVQEEAGGYEVTLVPPPGPGLLRIPGRLGLGLPTYERVNGLSPRWSAALGIGGDTADVLLTGTVAYRVAREKVDGGLELLIHPTSRSYASLRASRTTVTPDLWIRGDFANSSSSFFLRSDLRNYYESDEVTLSIGRLAPPPLIQGEKFFAPRIGARMSDDRSLKADDPWSVFNRKKVWRANPPIDEGTLASAFIGATGAWQGITASFSGTSSLEWSPSGIGDFDFAQVVAAGDWKMMTLWGHEIQVGGHLLWPVHGEAPRQRWSLLGGASTLPTFTVSQFRGDHLVFVRSSYLLPLNVVKIPLVGPPGIRLEHVAGTAWESGRSMPPIEQNLGIGLQVLKVLSAMIYIDPAESPLRGVVQVGIQLPV